VTGHSAVTLRDAFDGLIDYAGLFPPAVLPLPAVVERYAAYRRGPHARVLGRLVVPAGRLEEVSALGPWRNNGAGPGWRIAALAGSDWRADLTSTATFNLQHAPAAMVDVFEIKVATPDDVGRVAEACGPDLRLVCEVPAPTADGALLDAIARAGAVAKLRAGGVVAEGFPTAREVARFLWDAARRRLPCKATAGLHHVIRGDYPLTYEPGAACTAMHGVLNLLCAAAWIAPVAGQVAEVPEGLVAVLERREAPDGRADGVRLHWGHDVVEAAALVRARASSVTAIGSCSFEDPVAELQRLSLL
jgi:hypothetical protein